MIWTIAFRNLLRNFRRSAVTVFAIGIGGMAALLLGGFVTSIWFGVQTSMIQEQGNLQIYRKGYLQYGAADPEDYTVQDWEAVDRLIRGDEQLTKDVRVITPRIDLTGIAGNAQSGNSKTFIGQGIFPSQVDEMRSWDGWKVGQNTPPTGLSDADDSKVTVGIGMARMLGVCDALHVSGCSDRPPVTPDVATAQAGSEYMSLAEGEEDLRSLSASRSGKPQLNLLAATAEGIPNIVRVQIDGAQPQAIRAVDNAFVMMHYKQARELLYGDRPEATGIVMQIRDPERTDAVRTRVQQLIDEAGLDLAVYKFTEVDPTFNRIFGMFSFIFVAVSAVLAIIIVFTIVNTVSMNVMERVKEIGTVRALGFRKSFIVRLFMAESTLTGIAGAMTALALAVAVSTAVNSAGLQWTPPSNAAPLTVQLMVLKNPSFATFVLIALTVLAIIGSTLPTLRAARMNIVESLHRA